MYSINKKLFIFAFMIFSIFSTSTPAHSSETYHPAYARLLAKYVVAGEKEGIKTSLIDYDRWAKDKNHPKALRALQQVNPQKLTGKEKLAFWINAYNLLTLDLIIKTKERESIRNQGELFRSVWKVHHWQINGVDYTLHQIEHDILRPLGEPRIHFAINCASLSCPDLLNRPYRAAKLEQQLKAQTQAFLLNTTKGLAMTSSEIQLSKIFDWFEKDFGGEKKLIQFIRSYIPTLNKKAKIEGYFDYNWNLNSSP